MAGGSLFRYLAVQLAVQLAAQPAAQPAQQESGFPFFEDTTALLARLLPLGRPRSPRYVNVTIM